MKKLQFIIFVSIILMVYSSVNFYIFIRGHQAISEFVPDSIYYSLFAFVSASYILSRCFVKRSLFFLRKIFAWIGSYWLGFMACFFFILLFIDLLRLINVVFPFYPAFMIEHYQQAKLYTLISVLGFSFLIIVTGTINAFVIRVEKIKIRLPKKSAKLDHINIVALSDLHLGIIMNRKQFGRIIKKINALRPDIVLIAGDIIDESLAPVIWKDLGKMFLEINSKYGVYAVTGNHEFIGGAERAVDYISKYGVKFLRDEIVLIDNSFYILGREDRDVSRFTKIRRKQIPELMVSADSAFPTILLDHQPFNLSETSKNKIDLQISGHTHHGQMFPFNLITKKTFEVSKGYKKIDDTQFYVSSGVGTWGPPVRIGSRAEILQIQISLN